MKLTVSLIIALVCAFIIHVLICAPFYFFQDWSNTQEFVNSQGYGIFSIFYWVLGFLALFPLTNDIHYELWNEVL